MTLKSLLAAPLAVLTLTAPVGAEIQQRMANGTVADAMTRLETAVTDAGATVFARIDHAEGAASADMDLADSQLLIFGNPRLGTPVMQNDPRAGLFLPLKMLVYSDPDGQVWVAYEEIGDTFGTLNIDPDMGAIDTMENVLEKFSAAAAGS